LLPCVCLGEALAGTPAGPHADTHLCHHPAHRRTSSARCGGCPDYLFPVLTPLTPTDQVRRFLDLPPRAQPEGWWRWPNVQEAYRQAAREQAGRPPAPSPFRGRGVVIPGGGRYFPGAYVTIRVLRHLGCKLPVELWHLDGEMTPALEDVLRPHGVACVNADAVARERPFRFLTGHWWKGWQLKVYALAHSSFAEVLCLDADCYPAQDPSWLFDNPAYRAHGALFWPDVVTSGGLLRPEHWEVFGLPPRFPAFESGQVLVDKRRCWPELALTLWYNGHADYVYNILWGDKDTFNVAWRQLGREYGMLAPQAGWDIHTLLQYDHRGQVLFQHRCRDKFRFLGEPFPGTPQFFAENHFNDRLAHEALCFRLRDELAALLARDSQAGLPAVGGRDG
jgi:hypothetical protein